VRARYQSSERRATLVPQTPLDVAAGVLGDAFEFGLERVEAADDAGVRAADKRPDRR
jgi:hypothetical protein